MKILDKGINKMLNWESIETTIPEMVNLIQTEILEKASEKDLRELEKGMHKTWALLVGNGSNARYYPSSFASVRLRLQFSPYTHQIQQISLQDTENKKEYFIPTGKTSCTQLQRAVLRRIEKYNYEKTGVHHKTGTGGKFLNQKGKSGKSDSGGNSLYTAVVSIFICIACLVLFSHTGLGDLWTNYQLSKNKPNTYKDTSISASEQEKAIATVQNGYLGEYTDITVKEILDLTILHSQQEWKSERVSSDVSIVRAKYYEEGYDELSTTIEFMVLKGECFKITNYSENMSDSANNYDLLLAMNTNYLMTYVSQNRDVIGDYQAEKALVAKFNDISASSVQYGAPANYNGDRARICELFGEKTLDITVTELLSESGECDLTYYSGDEPNPDYWGEQYAEDTEPPIVSPENEYTEPPKMISNTEEVVPFNSVAGNALASVMMGKNNFTMAETGTHQSLFNMTEFMQFTFENYLMPTSFSVVDMDQDGTNEIVVGIDTDINGFRLVLRYEYGTVYGYPFVFRGMSMLSSDGITLGSSSAFESYYCRHRFSGLTIEDTILSDVEEQIALASWQDATWYDFTEDNVGKFFPNMDISFALPTAPPPSSTGQQNESFETYIDGYVKYGTEELRIRSGPGTEYEEVGRLREGTQVVILEIANSGNREWGRTDRGWVCMDYIQEGEPSASYIDTSSVYALDYINGTTGDVLNRIGRNYIMGSGFSGSKLFYYGSNTNIQFGFVPYDWTNPSISGNEPISVILVGGNARISQSLSADMNKAQLDAAAWNTPNVVNVSGQYTYGEMWGSVYMYEIETTSARILYMWYLDDGDNVDYPAGEVTISPK